MSKKTVATETTNFGYQNVSFEEKTRRVDHVFTSVAAQYDVMNDLMSLGVHRHWKKTLVAWSHVRPGNRVLDIAGGTGDLTHAFAKRVGEKGEVALVDINAAMLKQGRDRLLDSGMLSPVVYFQADAEALPFAENYFDCISLGFGLRNMTRKETALQEMCRVLKPGGQLLILEFSKPALPSLNAIYDTYSFSVLPKLGQLIAGDEDSYRYLVESIRRHPDQETLKHMILEVGFDACDYHNFSGGIVALHRCYKY